MFSTWAAGVAATAAVSAAVLGIATSLGTSSDPRPSTQSTVFNVSTDQVISAGSLGGVPARLQRITATQGMYGSEMWRDALGDRWRLVVVGEDLPPIEGGQQL